MTSVVKLKRSAVPGKVPTVDDLEFGEVAINTADGRMFIKKSSGVVQIKNTANNQPGDIILSGNPAYGAPEWIPADGSVYERGIYPKLDEIFGDPIYSWDLATKVSNPGDLPTGPAYGVDFSSDDTYLAVAHDNSPYLTIYKRDGETFTKLPDPDDLPAGTGRAIAFSPDDAYLAVGHDNAPYITIYKREGDEFTKLDDPDVIPNGLGHEVAFSSDSTYLAVSSYISPHLIVYKRDGDTFSKLNSPSSLPPANTLGVAFSPDDTYLATAHNNSPYVTIYKREGDEFTKLSNPDSLPTGNGRSVAFTPDGIYLAVGHNTYPYLTIYKRSEDTFTKLSGPNTAPTGEVQGVDFNVTGTVLAVAHSASPVVTLYERSGDTFSKLSDPNVLPGGTGGQSAAFSATDQFLAIGASNSPFVNIYKATPEEVSIQVPEYVSPDPRLTYYIYTGREPGDPYWDKVELLLHFDGENNGTIFPDSSRRGRTVLRTPSIVTSTAQFKYGTASGAFLSGSNQNRHLLVEWDSNLDIGAKDFTIEFWMRPTGYDGRMVHIGQIISTLNATSCGISLLANGLLNFFASISGSTVVDIASSTTVPTGAWTHVAVSRSNGVIRLFKDGVLEDEDEYAGSLTPAVSSFYIGELNRGSITPTYPYQGYLDELRVTVGVGRYTESFTPPTEPYLDY
jgi:3-carboxymuconate cyclase